MIQIYNSHLLNNKQRFIQAVIFGTLTAIACAIAVSLFAKTLGFIFTILYLATGFLISKVIMNTGRGVQKKFCILGAVLTLFSILLAELFIYAGYDILLYPNLWIQAFINIFKSWARLETSSMLSIVFQLFAIYIGYTNSSIASF